MQSSSGLGLSVGSFSSASGVLTGGCGSGQTSTEALGLGVLAPKEALGLTGEPCSEAGRLVGTLSEVGPGLGVALGGGGLCGGAEALCEGALFLGCSDPSLEVRVRRTTSGKDEACSEGSGAPPGAGAGEHGATSSWASPASGAAEGAGWAGVGPLQAGRGSSSPEELPAASSSTSWSLKGSSFISGLPSSWAESEASSSSLAEAESLSFFRASAEGLVGEPSGLETADVCTGEEMTKERLLPLEKGGRLDAEELKTGRSLMTPSTKGHMHIRRRQSGKKY